MAWSNEEFDRLDAVQNETLDPKKRAEVINQMQQVMYQDAPVIVLTHPYKLAAYRTDKWEGWEPRQLRQGPCLRRSDQPVGLLHSAAQDGHGGRGQLERDMGRRRRRRGRCGRAGVHPRSARQARPR